MERKYVLFSFFLIFFGANHAQTLDSLTKKTKEATPRQSLLPSDSLSIFQLIDSLVQMPELFDAGSSFVARLGYNSNINSSNESLNLGQYGLTVGTSYYHKTGLYLDATAYWSQEYSPSLYLTIGSAGYMKTVKKWTFNAEYSRYFYSFSDSTYNTPYTNTLGLSNYFDVKPFLFRLDYALYFGSKTVNRITPAVMLNFEKKNWLGMNRVLIYPSFNVLLGNETWQLYQPYSTRLAEMIYRVSHHLPLYYLQDNNKFGVLNYALTLPISISIKNWTYLISYTYNFPQALPGEQLGLTNSGYLSLSLIRYFNFKSRAGLIDFYKLPK